DDAMLASPTFTPDVAGNYQARLIVTDSRGLESAPAFINVNVAPCGVSNLAWSTTPLSASLQEPDGTDITALHKSYIGTRATLAASFTDAQGCGIVPTAPYRYQWALVLQPARSQAVLDDTAAAGP